jgi:Flp pilus assembly pilin Flp
MKQRGANKIQRRFEMNLLKTWAKQFIHDKEGVTSIEYALIASVTTLILLVAFGPAKVFLSTIFGKITSDLATALGI